MFCSRQPNNLINKITERSLRLTYGDSPVVRMCFIYQRNLQVLMNKVCEIVNDLASPLISSLYLFRNNEHNITKFSGNLHLPQKNS